MNTSVTGRRPSSTLFPYTTLFRSARPRRDQQRPHDVADVDEVARLPPVPEDRRLPPFGDGRQTRSEEHTSELQSRPHLVCRLPLETKKAAGAATGATSPRDLVPSR